MNLPTFSRGQDLTSIELNKLSSAIRAASVTSVVGGSLTRTPGGTTIIINDQVRGGGSTGESVIPCPFEVSDASDTDGMKVEIQWGLIWNMLPTGMLPNNDPPLRMAVTASSYVFSKVVFDTDTLLPNYVGFEVLTEIANNTSSTQYNLIARVNVDEAAEPKVISSIYNLCQQPFPSPCSLA